MSWQNANDFFALRGFYCSYFFLVASPLLSRPHGVLLAAFLRAYQ
jgi:hypothetical protein